MEMNIGKKIRELRQQMGRTQTELAEVFGVSPQAVSRWENGTVYPDMELLPSIANYFGVTIDSLFGYQSQREKKVNDYFEKIQAMNRENNGEDVCMDETIRFARACLVEFPEEKRLVYALASVLYNAGYVRYGEYHLTDENGYDIYDVERHRGYAEWKDAIPLYEKALTLLENGELRDRAVRELIQLYVNTGERSKAAAIIDTSPELSACREFLRINGCDGQKRAEMYGAALLKTVHHCAHLMISGVIVNKANLSPDESVQIIRNAISMYGLVCTDGNYGIYHASLACMYLFLSENLWLAGDKDGAFEALDSALEYARKHESARRQTNVLYTSPLLRLNPIEFKEFTEAGIAANLSEDWPWWSVPDCSKVKAEMSADPRWADWVRRTKEG